MSIDHGCQAEVEKSAKHWSTVVVKETLAIQRYQRTLQLIHDQMATADKNAPPDGTTGSVPVDPETRIEEIKQKIRLAETEKLKAEARLAVIGTSGIDVDNYISSAQAQSEELLVEDEDSTATQQSVAAHSRQVSVSHHQYIELSHYVILTHADATKFHLCCMSRVCKSQV